MLWIRGIAFTILVPGLVAVWIPYRQYFCPVGIIALKCGLDESDAYPPTVPRSACDTIGLVKESPHQTIKRRSDEPTLQIGDRVLVKEGVIGVVLARYIPSRGNGDVCYVVEVLSKDGEKREREKA